MGLAIAIALDTLAQLAWKAAVDHIPPAAPFLHTLAACFRQPLFYLMIVVYLGAFANWLAVLAHADLSYAQPITALSYLSVTFCSRLLFHEPLSLLGSLGLLLILLGVWSISLTVHQTAPSPRSLCLPEVPT